MKTYKLKEESDDTILKDGECLRTSIHLMDSMQRAVAGSPSINDFVGHRPGYAPINDQDRQRRRDMQAGYNAIVGDRWKSPAVTESRDSASSSLQLTKRSQASASYNERITNAWRRG